MSYAQRKELSGNRTLAIILVAILQLGLGYAIVTGLAYNVIKKAAQVLKTFDPSVAGAQRSTSLRPTSVASWRRRLRRISLQRTVALIVQLS